MSIKRNRIFLAMKRNGFSITWFLKKCVVIPCKIWFQSEMQNILSSVNRNRRIAIPIVLIVLFILYTSPTWFTWSGSRQTSLDPLQLCLESKLESFRRSIEQANSVVKYYSNGKDFISYLPFVGNGYIGMPVDELSAIHIRNSRTLSTLVPFSAAIKVNIEGFSSREADVTNFLTGSVYHVQCLQLGTSCVNVVTQIYAHRIRLGLLVQDIRIHNPLNEAVTIEFSLNGVTGWKDVSTEARGNNQLYVGSLDHSDASKMYLVAIAMQKIREPITLKSGGTFTYTMLIAAEYVEHDRQMVSVLQKNRATIIETVLLTLTNAQQVKSTEIALEHTQVWHQLWQSGFSISQSKAAGALNGDRINLTIYNVLSHVTAPLYDSTRHDHDELEYMVHFPDRCYNGHHTLQNSKMWGDMATKEQLLEVVNTWLITLAKQGCNNVMKAGADGVMQAMVLSFGALRMTNDHLEMNTHPKDLHRDQMFRRINYGNHTHVNISVEIGEDNKALLYVSLDANDKPYYACDAGCVDTPLRLSKERSQFPVKLTDPLMPILYISVDKQHMEELKHAIHVKEIGEAPAHEHHVIALHKHGHQYGGLPVLFWASLGFLILVFHLFLFKLIYNEYCGTPHEYERHQIQTRARYNL